MTKRKLKHVNDLTDQEVADAFIHYGRNMAFAGVMEVVFAAARLDEPLGKAVASVARDANVSLMSESLNDLAGLVPEARGRLDLIASVVKRYAFRDPFSADEEDFDPLGIRSVNIAVLLLKYAAEASRERDESTGH